MKPTLLFYCQHALGMGHLTRSFALAHALSGHFQVVLLNGGLFPEGLTAPAGVTVIDLPPLGLKDGHELVSQGSLDLAQAKQVRHDMLLEALARHSPDVVLIELFPFGRKKFAYELLPLLKAARRLVPQPQVVCSVRDILVTSRADSQHHDDRARWIAQRYFDSILVHADPNLVRFGESFRPRRALDIPVLYTGFVLGHRAPELAHRGDGPILVSAGGGIVGLPLFLAALDAHALLWRQQPKVMRIIAGPFLPEADWQALQRAAAGRNGIELVRVVPNMREEMQAASISISQCGYNTALDIVASRVPALVVPFAEGREDEQANRATRLERLGLLRVMASHLLSGQRLADEIAATSAFKPASSGLDMNGASMTARIIASQLTHARRPKPLPIPQPFLTELPHVA